jgi:mono/diheme cytochrome c family protein
VPDLREHPSTSTVSENGRYRIPKDNPFAKVAGARGEIWAYGIRNPHRLVWDVDPARPTERRLLAFNIGLVTWETVIVVHKGANYGYPLREGTQSMSSTNGMGPLPDDDVIPVQVSDTVTAGTVRPAYPVAQYPHTPESGGDAIANGFVYRGKMIPALRDKLVLGDITTGRIWYADRSALLAADDGIATTVAPLYEVQSDLRRLSEETYRARGGQGPSLPGRAMISGRGRVDLRLAMDDEGELYVLTRSDGMIRKVVAARTVTGAAPVAGAVPGTTAPSAAGQTTTSPRNPVAATAESIEKGKRVYDVNCALCHGALAQGAVKAGTPMSIIEEQRKQQPPDLTDDRWDHGSSDGDIFAVTKRGVPATMMPGYDGRIADEEIWSVVNYLRSLVPR